MTKKDRDPRLPANGTVIQKKNRHGVIRCECTVEEDGIHYKGEVYRSLSGSARAASKDLGLKGTVNGYLFWGLVKTTKKSVPVVETPAAVEPPEATPTAVGAPVDPE